MSRALLVMAKRPSPGTTKTRLSPPFSPEEAAACYACFLADTLDIARAAAGLVAGLNLYLAFTPHESADFFQELAPDFAFIPQSGHSLGERLDHVISAAFAAGHRQVAAINSDSPSLPAAYVAEAFTTLDDPAVDAVFGPCEDGGYYLIGLTGSQPRLVREVRMSRADTLAETLRVAADLGLRVALLPSWYDVDSVADLDRLAGDPNLGRHTREFLNR